MSSPDSSLHAFVGAQALSPFRLGALLERLRAREPAVTAVQARPAVVPSTDRWALLLLITLVVAVGVGQRTMFRQG